MTTDTEAKLALLREINASARFNTWLGLEVQKVEQGAVEIGLPWREDLGQYAGFLHAGLIGALIDTACGFAAALSVGRVLASHFSVNCLSPAVGVRFVARGRIVKAGRRQVFTAAELFALDHADTRKLVATGEALLLTVNPAPDR